MSSASLSNWSDTSFQHASLQAAPWYEQEGSFRMLIDDGNQEGATVEHVGILQLQSFFSYERDI